MKKRKRAAFFIQFAIAAACGILLPAAPAKAAGSQAAGGDVPESYSTALHLNGDWKSIIKESYTLIGGNTYYLELAGGMGGADRFEGGFGGYQYLALDVTEDTDITVIVGGRGTWADGGAPDGQKGPSSGGGGGSSSVWVSGDPLIENNGIHYTGGGTLLAAAGGGGGGGNRTCTAGGKTDPGSGGIGTGLGNGKEKAPKMLLWNGYHGQTFFGTEAEVNAALWKVGVSPSNWLLNSGTPEGRIDGGGGGGGFPAGTNAYESWAGWKISPWTWLEWGDVGGTGGQGYNYARATGEQQLDGIRLVSYEGKDGVNADQGYVTLYAQLQELIVDPNGGEWRGSQETQVLKGEINRKITIEEPIRLGYAFLGWKKEGPGVFDPGSGSFTFEKGSSTLTAKWEPMEYRVAYHKNGADGGSMEPQTFLIGVEQQLAMNKYTRTGYHFQGWSRTADGAAEYRDGERVLDLGGLGDTVDLYAVWEPNSYRIVYHGNGETSGQMEDTVLIYGEEGQLSACEFQKTGYHCIGWSWESGGIKAFEPEQQIYNLTELDQAVIDLYAVWESNRYQIVLDGNQADAGQMAPLDMQYGLAATLPKNQYHREGYTFIGWQLVPDNTPDTDWLDGQEIQDLTNEDQDVIVLYAKWKKRVEIYFDYHFGKDENGNIGMRFTEEIYNATNSIRIAMIDPEPVREGYQFAGWTGYEPDYPNNERNPWEEHWNEQEGRYILEGEWKGEHSALGNLSDGTPRATAYVQEGMNGPRTRITVYAVWDVLQNAEAYLDRSLGSMGNPQIFQEGEQGAAVVRTTGYADQIEVLFPEAQCYYPNSGDMYSYEGMNGKLCYYQYDAEGHPIGMNTGNDAMRKVLGPEVNRYCFSIPLYYVQTPGYQSARIRVHFTYKGVESVQELTPRYQVSGSVLDTFKVRIRIRGGWE